MQQALWVNEMAIFNNKPKAANAQGIEVNSSIRELKKHHLYLVCFVSSSESATWLSHFTYPFPAELSEILVLKGRLPSYFGAVDEPMCLRVNLTHTFTLFFLKT